MRRLKARIAIGIFVHGEVGRRQRSREHIGLLLLGNPSVLINDTIGGTSAIDLLLKFLPIGRIETHTAQAQTHSCLGVLHRLDQQ